RDRNVTGVQTCALPISREPTHAAGPVGVHRRVSVSECVVRWQGRSGGRHGGFARAWVCGILARAIELPEACGGGFPHGASKTRAQRFYSVPTSRIVWVKRNEEESPVAGFVLQGDRAVEGGQSGTVIAHEIDWVDVAEYVGGRGGST